MYKKCKAHAQFVCLKKEIARESEPNAVKEFSH